MEITYKKLKELKPYRNNPRRNEKAVKALAASIEEFGFKNPIIATLAGEIICGHTRYKAAKKLKLDRVPVIIADDLTDEQVRAYRLADNRVAELADWDPEQLDAELAKIGEIDMSLFEFEIPELTGTHKRAPEGDGYYGDERERTFDRYHLSEYDELRAEGWFDMPVLLPCDAVPDDLIGFNYVLSTDQTDCGVHFYIDDYQFERVWTDPGRYIEKLEPFQCVLTPDFSLYRDMPMAMKIWNTYRSRLFGQMCQDAGLNVVPTVSWAEPETYEFCFDGLPKEATLSVSTIGVKRDPEAQWLWRSGMDAMIERLRPERLLVYGGALEYNYGKIEVLYYQNHVTEQMRNV